MRTRKPKEFDEYIVADPQICGGQLTFKGTRLLVKDVLYYVAKGRDWDWIAEAYANRINHAAIAEAIQLTCKRI